MLEALKFVLSGAAIVSALMAAVWFIHKYGEGIRVALFVSGCLVASSWMLYELGKLVWTGSF